MLSHLDRGGGRSKTCRWSTPVTGEPARPAPHRQDHHDHLARPDTTGRRSIPPAIKIGDTPIRLQNVTPRLAYLNSYLLA
jgi:hypothetical protein